MPQPPAIAELAHQRPACAIDILAMRRAEIRPRTNPPARAANSRCASSKNGQSRNERSLNTPLPFWGEGQPARGRQDEGTQSPSNSGACFAANASNARRKSPVAMQIAWACASISIAVSRLTAHSALSWVLVMPWAKFGPSARLRASACASRQRVFGEPVVEAPGEALLGAHHPAGEQQFRSAALADDPRQDRAGAHVAAGEADPGEQERRLGRRRRDAGGRRPWR